MVDFRGCVSFCSVEELKVFGCFFIWLNKYEEGYMVFLKLDRMFINECWIDIFFISVYYVYFEGVLDYYFFVLILIG